MQTKKALFILHEGIGSTIFNSQVLVHAKGMREHGIEFDILTYNTLDKTWELSNSNLLKFRNTDPDVKIILKKGMNIFYPLSLLYNLILLIKFFRERKGVYSFIQARADYTAFVSILAKPIHGLPVVWDCRGDAVSELKDALSRKNGLIKSIGNLYLVSFNRFCTYVNCKRSSGVIFVSNALSKLYEDRLKKKNYQIIPCPVSEKKFFFDSKLRSEMRSKLNILDSQSVYLYSGSMIAYQSLNEQYQQYEYLLKSPQNIIIIATSDPEIANDFFKVLKSDRLIITSVGFDDMNSYYNLADFAFLMREEKQLNHVASPTKFGEYCLTGLPVIMNDTVEQAFSLSRHLGNYVSYLNIGVDKLSNEQRSNIAIESRKYYSRQVLNLKYIELYNNIN